MDEGGPKTHAPGDKVSELGSLMTAVNNAVVYVKVVDGRSSQSSSQKKKF